MADDFDASLAFVLHWEGGFSDDPDDHGGPTNRGITQSEYDTWRKQQGLQTRDVRDIDDRELETIYRGDYWSKAGSDWLPRNVDLLQFDTAVLMGVTRSICFLQAAAGVRVDGVLGPVTKDAVAGANLNDLATKYCSSRESYCYALVQKDPSQQKFLGGWLNRLNALRATIGVTTASRARIPDRGIDPRFDLHPDVTDRERLQDLIKLGSDAYALGGAKQIAGAVVNRDPANQHDTCAATLSCILNFAGIYVGVREAVLDLAACMENREWRRIQVGQQIAEGDIGVVIVDPNSPAHQLHHIYLVVDASNQSAPDVADNQGNGIHSRPVGGGAMTGVSNSADATSYFLRAP